MLFAVGVAMLVLAPGCGGCEDDAPADGSGQSVEPADPHGIDLAERDRLRALGYVGVAEPLPEDAPVGVLKFDRVRAQPGLNLFTNAEFCTAQLIALDGTVLHEWSQPEQCNRWSSAFLTPNGDLLVIWRSARNKKLPEAFAKARAIRRLSWDGESLWNRSIPVHHDLDLQPDGRFFTLTYRHSLHKQIHPTVPLRDHSLVLMSADGEVLEEAPLAAMLAAAGDVLRVVPLEPRFAEKMYEVDLIHANSVERMPYPELVQRGLPYGEDHILVCLRSQDLLVVVDWSERRIVWAWGRGELSGPHDASWLANGNILVFDNGLGRSWSRIVEFDPVTRQIVWQYRAPKPTDFYSKTQGTNQRLANGNTLITESGTGRVFEVTTGGDVVWEFRNPNLTEEREPSVIPRMRRLENLNFVELLSALAAGRPLPPSD